MKTIQAALYARVSSDQQANAETIVSQLSALRERTRIDDCLPAAEREFIDEGWSGATLMRPALERLHDAAALGGIDRLYVHSPDRLARKYAYQVLLIDDGAVQAQLQENRAQARTRKRGARYYLLQGLLAYKQCGYAYYGKPLERQRACAPLCVLPLHRERCLSLTASVYARTPRSEQIAWSRWYGRNYADYSWIRTG